MKNFEVQSSVCDTADAMVRPVAPPAVSESRAKACVIVAEDDRIQREMLGMVLELRGFRVVLAKDGSEALDAVVANRPDAVVSDMEMPVLDGLGLIRSVRASSDGTSVPIVVWSALDDDDARIREAATYSGVTVISKARTASTICLVLLGLVSATLDRS